MREDINFDLVDEVADSYGVILDWETANQTIRILFNLALESLKEIDAFGHLKKQLKRVKMAKESPTQYFCYL
jgi:hypothetical protein